MKPAAPVTKTGWSDIQYLSTPHLGAGVCGSRVLPTRPAPITVRSSCGRVYDKFAMADELATSLSLRGAATVAIAALLSALLIVLLRPVLVRYALARPNARSSHSDTDAARRRHRGHRRDHRRGRRRCTLCPHRPPSLTGIVARHCFAAVVLVAGVGAADDIRPIGVVPRLLLQALAVGAGDLRAAGRAARRAVPAVVDRARCCWSSAGSGSSISSTSWTASTG